MNPTPTNSPATIEMREVAVATLKDPNLTVAEGVNWTVHTGEFWVVAAPQHSGKSDFLMTTGGIMSPSGGDYFFLGERMPIFAESRMAQRLKLGFVFDGGQLLGHLTVAENIALPLRYHLHLAAAEIASRVNALLEITELTPWANSTPGNVGRSWRQRAGLARALTLQPELLLLDSPLTGLDARHINWWLSFLDGLSRGHKIAGDKPVTLVATADDLRPWQRHAGRVACLTQRRLVVFDNWEAAERSGEQAVRGLLQEPTRHD